LRISPAVDLFQLRQVFTQVIIALSADTFGAWETSAFAPEAEFLDQVKAIPGITNVETQTYTLMTM
jgi:hypothetical protein